jgi:hypothetical protein
MRSGLVDQYQLKWVQSENPNEIFKIADVNLVQFQSVLELSPSRVKTPNPVSNLVQTGLTNQQQQSNQLIHMSVYHDVLENTSASKRNHYDSITVDEKYVDKFEEISKRVSCCY